eukprot:COSAG01_NODE_30884_length_607_cov_32.527559_1_plen_173_part_01
MGIPTSPWARCWYAPMQAAAPPPRRRRAAAAGRQLQPRPQPQSPLWPPQHHCCSTVCLHDGWYHLFFWGCPPMHRRIRRARRICPSAHLRVSRAGRRRASASLRRVPALVIVSTERRWQKRLEGEHITRVSRSSTVSGALRALRRESLARSPRRSGARSTPSFTPVHAGRTS